jgi:hypothetical protein
MLAPVYWIYPEGYVTALVLGAALVGNAALLAKAAALRAAALITLTLLSLGLSTLIIVIFAHAIATLPT